MNELKVIEQNGQLLVDSRDVAEMVGKEHSNLMRDIRGYVTILENSNVNSQNFFIPSTYKTEGNNKTYDCFLLDRKGCDMVANKMTGEKGVLFTATYVTRFEEMEQKIKNKPVSIEDAIIYSMSELKSLKQQQLQQGYELSKLRLVVDNEIWITENQKAELRSAVNSRVYTLQKEEYEVHYQAVWGALKRHFGVAKYDKIPRKFFETAMNFVNGWYPPKKQQSLSI